MEPTHLLLFLLEKLFVIIQFILQALDLLLLLLMLCPDRIVLRLRHAHSFLYHL